MREHRQDNFCKLCNLPNKLIKAHIIPNWMYTPLFNEKHRLISLRNGEHPDLSQDLPAGEYDFGITCARCDGNIGTYEEYARKVFIGGAKGIQQNIERCNGMNMYHFSGMDYKKFKLFLLSLLWKSSVSSREMFKNIKLNSEVESTIREMILNGNPGSDTFFPTAIYGMHSAGAEHLQRLIISPRATPGLFSFYISGYLLIYTDTAIAKAEGYYLRETGTITIIGLNPTAAIELIDHIWGLSWLKQDPE